MAVTASAEEVHGVLSAAVDGTFYRATYPDLSARGVDPLRHYVHSGWREGRDPAPWFSVTAYLEANDDVRLSGVEPFHHYLTQGWREGRDATPSVHASAYLLGMARGGETAAWRFEPSDPNGPTPEDLEAIELAEAQAVAEAEAAREREAAAARAQREAAHRAARNLIAGEFDPAYYAKENPALADAGVDLLDHFLTEGWREGRDPNPWFSLKEYLDTYPDIAEAGINPFVHYVHAGRAEGRLARNELGFRYEMIADLRPMGERLAKVVKASTRLKIADDAVLTDALANTRTGLRDLHLTFSHDDYTANTGGVQLCLQREGGLVAERGIDHLHVYPAKPWPVVRTSAEAGHLGVVLNGRRVGIFAPKTLAGVLRAAAAKAGPGRRSLAIHSLLGHAADETAEIAAAAGIGGGYFWLHDFASLCAGYHLLRNDVQDCAAPPPDSAACGICVYGAWRARHLAEHERLFERLELTVVSPSEPTLELWRRSWSFAAKGEVLHPHAALVARGAAQVTEDGRPLRVAYLGMPAAHKGWHVFRDLLRRHGGDPRYEFMHLGGQAVEGLPVEFRKVVVTASKPRAMQAAIEAMDVDVVLMWPLCRETFSFAAYEAVAAGAALVTGPDSGNVAAFVESSGHGWVLPNEDALSAVFDGGEIAALARGVRKPMLYDLAFSGVTADLLAPEAVR